MKKKIITILALVAVSVALFTLPAMADDGYIFRLDLSGYEAGAEPEGLDAETYCVSDGVRSSEDNPNAGTDNFVIKEAESSVDGSKLKYVEYKGAGSAASTNAFGYLFDSAYTDSFAVDLGFKIVKGTGGRSFRRNGSSTTLLSFTNIGATGGPSADNYGFYRLRIVCQKISDTQYTVTSYDRLNNNKLLVTGTHNITSWDGFNIYMWGNNGVITAVAQMDVFPYATPTASGVNTDYLMVEDDELKVEFDKNMDDTLFSDASFILTDVTSGREVAVGFVSYDAATREASIKLHEYLDDGHEYKLTFAGLADTFGLAVGEDEEVTFTTDFGYTGISDVVFTDSSDTPIDSLEDVLNPKATVSIAAIPQGRSVALLLALFDDNGRLVDSNYQSVSEGDSLTCALTGSVTVENGFTLKCYAWEITADGMTALREQAKILE